MKKGIFILNPEPYETVYGEECRAEIAKLIDIQDVCAPPQTASSVREDPSVLREVELIFSAWGAPVMGREFLDAAPRLEAVFYGAGSVRNFVTDELWERGIVVTSALVMNAVPVAEFTLSQILFSLKRGWQHVMEIERRGEKALRRFPVPGAYETKVGVISLGAIGRRVCELLKSFDVEVWAHDPFVGDEVFENLGAKRAGLDEIFARCDVVSLHAPKLPATVGMITRRQFDMMKRGATFINTARGDLVREGEMADALARRPDLWAVLDVLAQEDRGARARLIELPNVIITPHIAGSKGHEHRRMGRAMVEELKRYLSGDPLKWRVTRERFAVMA